MLPIGLDYLREADLTTKKELTIDYCLDNSPFPALVWQGQIFNLAYRRTDSQSTIGNLP